MSDHPSVDTLDDAADLLLDLGEAMHGAQMPSDMVEGYLLPVAEKLGVTADLALLQSYLAVDVRGPAGHRTALRRIDFDTHWRLARVHDLAELAVSFGEGRWSPAEARVRLHQIVHGSLHYSRMVVIAAYSVYGAAVAARIGGSLVEMLVAALLGTAAGLIHLETTRHRKVDLQKTFLAGLVGTGVVLASAMLLPSLDLARALFGGVTLLVPAMVIAIGTHELASGALESGSARLAYGCLRFLMLAAGIVAMLNLWPLAAPLPQSLTATGLPVAAVMGILVVGSVALVFCLQARMSDAPSMVVGVLAAYGSQALAKSVLGEDFAPFVAAFAVGVAAYVYEALFRGGFAAPVLVSGLLQLAPGFLGTEAVFALLRGERGGHDSFFRVLLVALQLVIGLLLAAVLFARVRCMPRVPSPGRGGESAQQNSDAASV